MNPQLSGFTSEKGRAAFLAAYDRVLGEWWPVPHQSVEAPTRFGPTHTIVSGPPAAPPPLLLVAGQKTRYDPRRALQHARRLLPTLEGSDVVPGAGHFVSAARPDPVDPRIVAFLEAETRRAAAATTAPQAPTRRPRQE